MNYRKTLFEPKSPLIASSGALNEETDLIDLFNGYVNKPNDDESTSTNSDFQNRLFFKSFVMSLKFYILKLLKHMEENSSY